MTASDTYSPFGESNVTSAASTNSALYAGRENDTGDVYFMRARYYNPRLLRFMSEDLLLRGESNRYSYARNLPTMPDRSSWS